jgi:hypothetical protein
VGVPAGQKQSEDVSVSMVGCEGAEGVADDVAPSAEVDGEHVEDGNVPVN